MTNEINRAKIILFLKKKYPLLTLSWQRKHKVKYQFYIVIDGVDLTFLESQIFYFLGNFDFKKRRNI